MVTLRLKEKVTDRHDMKMRNMKHWDVIKYNTEIDKIDWSSMLQETNIDLINNTFENELLAVMDKMCPLKIDQRRKNNNNRMIDELKVKMLNRDLLREVARVSNLQTDWEAYRVARNNCVKDISKVKTAHMKKLFENMENEKYVKGMYKLTAQLCSTNSVITPQQFIHEGRIVTKPTEMANLQLDCYIN